MSIQAMSAVLALPGDLISPAERLVLISLANHANKEGRESYPARATIGEETGLHPRTVTRALAKLRTTGLIRVAHYPGRNANNEYLGPFVYNLHIPGLSTDPGPALDSMSIPRSSTHRQRGGRGVQVTEEPKKKRNQSFPQPVSEVLDGMGFDG